VCSSDLAHAQPGLRGPDTVSLSLDSAERRFLESNLLLLAAKFNIVAARAAVLQARLWSNPNIAIEQNVYNPDTKRYFDFTPQGNTEVQLQQLITLAGKRGKQVRIAEIGTDIAEQSFYEVLRSLKLELRTDLYDLYFLQRSLRFYDVSVSALRRTVASSENILEKRSILLSEVLRVKSLLFSLENERQGVLNRASQIQWDLHVLLNDTAAVPYLSSIDRGAADSISLADLSFQQLLELARENRPDLKVAASNVRSAEATLALQKALVIPDVTVGGRWSQAGSYIPNYYALSVSVDLPIFNRNQGNILESEIAVRSVAAAYAGALASVEKDVATAYDRATSTDKLYRTLDRTFTAQYEQLADGMIRTYENRNLSVIQFTDFYESYRTSVVQMNQLQNDRLDAIEGLNYATGTDVVRIR
jgi:cobalt-zinc-cadmium efflux system outer membrane protein